MNAQSATVIATFSRRMRLLLADGKEVDARIKGKRIKAVCGDMVKAEPIDNESDWLITEISERRNELTRPNMRGQVEVLAANVDTLVVVAAVSPLPDWYIVDRYLCAAELMGVNAIVVFNKVDLLAGHDIEIEELQEYRNIGLPVVECSAETGFGMKDLQDALSGQRAIVVGQSGVGKSSMINHLVIDSQQRTADISSKTGEGRHTTVNSVMMPLQGGGAVIDSPGVRDYAPALLDSSDAASGFREIAKAAQSCRFANCRHLREPGCAVKLGVDNDTISYRRYESYKRMVNLTEKLAEGRY
ncbi:MAG: ribosome small subunit-dependent GTPase A [Gammaproteobacteria bacterium]|nr:ribosome small subunit-dependent GTPase A [Gammaproteobacteria bacterium]MDH5240017.1 ribosome small subunit-dependent GTPase A [Gammaproteobacteria bacterium]MDH5262027.1 ribosome small subunit-dependent GTPase A [Gammaproteobacteria bacterium]MDH5583531.1 ribosome small subunit-dependent GTPase A [Gammaproteobacteria bacterium]